MISSLPQSDLARRGCSTFKTSTLVQATAEELYAFHQDPHNLDLVMPPTMKVLSIKAELIAREGDIIVLEVKELGLIWMRWKCRWREAKPPVCLMDEMLEGPFRMFEHRHLFSDQADGFSTMTDEVTYAFGSSWWGRLISETGVRFYLHLLFAWRHYQTRRWFAQASASFPSR
jgi:ligand-binding SRPBCC domain-containing protein